MDIDTKYKLITNAQPNITIGQITKPNPVRSIYLYHFWPTKLNKASDDMINDLLKKTEIFEGPSDAYDYSTMNFKYQQIQESLDQFKTKMHYVWYSKDHLNTKRILMKSNDNNFIWYLAQNTNPNHHFYVGGKLVKFSVWFNMSLEERQELYDKYVLKKQ